jgi:hypothetical protein
LEVAEEDWRFPVLLGCVYWPWCSLCSDLLVELAMSRLSTCLGEASCWSVDSVVLVVEEKSIGSKRGSYRVGGGGKGC